jgi:hypothetical protein
VLSLPVFGRSIIRTFRAEFGCSLSENEQQAYIKYYKYQYVILLVGDRGLFGIACAIQKGKQSISFSPFLNKSQP